MSHLRDTVSNLVEVLLKSSLDQQARRISQFMLELSLDTVAPRPRALILPRQNLNNLDLTLLVWLVPAYKNLQIISG